MNNAKKKRKLRQLIANTTDGCRISLTCKDYPGNADKCSECHNWETIIPDES